MQNVSIDDRVISTARMLVEDAVLCEIAACGKERRSAVNVSGFVESHPSSFANPDNTHTLPDVLPLGDLAWPREVLEMCKAARFSVMSGIFPQLNRVWLTIDNKLVLWDYRTPNEFATFEQISQVIITVGEPVRPISQTLPPHITFLLPVATSSMCCLLGLCTINEQDLACVRIVNINFNVAAEMLITKIVPHQCSGRIFCASENGSVYELQYTREGTLFVPKVRLVCLSSWFASKPILGQFSSLVNSVKETWTGPKPSIRDIVINENRSLLFTLNDANVITTWRITSQGLRHLHTLHHKRATLRTWEQESSPSSYRYRGLKARRLDFMNTYYNKDNINGKQKEQECASNVNSHSLIRLFCLHANGDANVLMAIAANGEHFQYYLPNESIGDSYFTLELRVSSTTAPAMLMNRTVCFTYANEHLLLLAHQPTHAPHTNDQDDVCSYNSALTRDNIDYSSSSNNNNNNNNNNNSSINGRVHQKDGRVNEQLVAITLPYESNKPQSLYNEIITVLRLHYVNSNTNNKCNDCIDGIIKRNVEEELLFSSSQESSKYAVNNVNRQFYNSGGANRDKCYEKKSALPYLSTHGIAAIAQVPHEQRCSNNDLCWQLTSSSACYLTVHGNGLSLYTHLRPVDTLYLILAASYNDVCRELLLARFASLHTDADYAAMLLQIAMGALNVDTCANATILQRFFTPLPHFNTSSLTSQETYGATCVPESVEETHQPRNMSETHRRSLDNHITNTTTTTTTTTARPHLTGPTLTDLGTILANSNNNNTTVTNTSSNNTSNVVVNNISNISLDVKRLARELLLQSILAQCKVEACPLTSNNSGDNNNNITNTYNNSSSGLNSFGNSYRSSNVNSYNFNEAGAALLRMVTIELSPFISAVNLIIARTCCGMWDVPLNQLAHSETTLTTPITVLSLLLSFLRSQGIDPTTPSAERWKCVESDLNELQRGELQQTQANKLTMVLSSHNRRLQLQTIKSVERLVLEQAYFVALKALQTALLLREVRYLPLPEWACMFTFAQVIRDESLALRLGSFYTKIIIDAFDNHYTENCVNVNDPVDGDNAENNNNSCNRERLNYAMPLGNSNNICSTNNSTNTVLLMEWNERLERFVTLQQRCNYFFSDADRQLCEVHIALARLTQGINFGSFSETELQSWARTQIKPHAASYWRSGALKRMTQQLCELRHEKLAIELLLHAAYQLDPEGRCLPLYSAERAKHDCHSTQTSISNVVGNGGNTTTTINANSTNRDASAAVVNNNNNNNNNNRRSTSTEVNPSVSSHMWRNWSLQQIYETKKEILDLILAVIDEAWQCNRRAADDLLGGPHVSGTLWQIEPHDELAHYYFFDWLCAARSDTNMAQSLRSTLVASSSRFVERYLTDNMICLQEEYNRFMRDVKKDVYKATAQSLRLALSELSDIPPLSRLSFRVRCLTDAIQNARQSHSRELPQIEQQLRLIKAQQDLCAAVTQFANSNKQELHQRWEVNGAVMTESDIAQQHCRLLNESVCEATTLLRIAGMYARFGGLEIQLEILSASNVNDPLPYAVCLNRLYEVELSDKREIEVVEALETLTQRLLIRHRDIFVRHVPWTFTVRLLESYVYEVERRGSRSVVSILIGTGHIEPSELFLTYVKLLELYEINNMDTSIRSNIRNSEYDAAAVGLIPCEHFDKVNVSAAYLIYSCATVVECMSNAIHKVNSIGRTSNNINIITANPFMLSDAVRTLRSIISRVKDLHSSPSHVPSVDDQSAMEQAEQLLKRADPSTDRTIGLQYAQ